MKYILSWCCNLPIKTIIIGQNPYPQNIYPDIGAALSYDPDKIKGPPKSVQVIAEDLFNHDETDKDSTISCIRDLWCMVENGVIAINENIFANITDLGKSKNTTAIKEAESQILLLQTVMTESYNLGQEQIELIALGRPATAMCSVIRSWCPSDLIKLKFASAYNPAGVQNKSDTGSQPITLGNSTVSKIFSRIVKEYSEMSQKKAGKVAQQNQDALNKATESILETSRNFISEGSSFMKRIKGASESSNETLSVDDMCNMLQGVMDAMNKHAQAVRVHSVSFLINVNDVRKLAEKIEQRSKAESAKSPLPSAPPPSAPSASHGGGRRVKRPAATASSSGKIDPIKEESAIPEPLPMTPQRPPPVPPSTTGSATPGRRRVVRRASSTVAPSEYTVDDKSEVSTAFAGNTNIMPAEAVHMRSIAQWFADHMDGNTTYSEILNSSAEERSVGSALARDVLQHIRMRSSNGAQYDAYIEVEDASSETYKWCEEYASTLLK